MVFFLNFDVRAKAHWAHFVASALGCCFYCTPPRR